MDAEPLSVVNAYLDHLSDGDLTLLAAEPGPPDAGFREFFRRHPGRLDEVLSSRRLFESVFVESIDSEPLLAASPFLVFALCVHRAAAELQSTTYVTEWVGPGRRTPVFDVAELREFLADPRRRLFLAELLSSYTHVASGSIVQFTRRGLRRHRFSELDPVRLAGLLDVVSDEERPGILRRLGDLALFLTGVFPDALARRGFGPIDEGRLLRSGRYARPAARLPQQARAAGLGPPGPVDLLERLGRSWYGGAFSLMPRPVPANLVVIGELPARFGQARRILNFITERFVFSNRERWFGHAAG